MGALAEFKTDEDKNMRELRQKTSSSPGNRVTRENKKRGETLEDRIGKGWVQKC